MLGVDNLPASCLNWKGRLGRRAGLGRAGTGETEGGGGGQREP